MAGIMISISIAKTIFPKLGLTLAGSVFMALTLVAADTSPWTPWILGCLVPIGLAILGMLWQLVREKSKERREMERRLTTLETQMTPFWATLQTKLADALHHPHPESKESDRLLERLEKLTITPEERARLRVLLAEVIANPNVSVEEKAKAQLLLVAMPLVIAERHAIIADVVKQKAAILIPSLTTTESPPIKVEVVSTPEKPVITKPAN